MPYQYKKLISNFNSYTYQDFDRILRHQDPEFNAKLDINDIRRESITLLIQACDNARPDLARLFLEHGADPNAIDSSGQTALHSVLICGLDCLKVLIEYDANVNIADIYDMTPILLTEFKSFYLPQIKFLINNGANIVPVDPPRFVPVRRDAGLVQAVYEDCIDVVEFLILEAGADVNYNNTDNPPLHMAMEENHIEIAKLLVKHGADVNIRSSSGNTTLHVMVSKYNKNNRKTTLDQINFLLEHNAIIDIPNKSGKTPIDIARQNNADEVVKLLEDWMNFPMVKGVCD